MSILSRDYFNFSVFKQPLRKFLRDFQQKVPLKVTAERAAFVLPEQPYATDEGSPPPLLWSPRCAPELTAFMPHVSSGNYHVASFANSKLNVSFVSVRSKSQEADWPINEFQCFENGQERRFVRAFQDSPRWDFFERGLPLEFEHVENYKKRRIRDRLRRDDVLSYVEAWGAQVRNEDFWCTDADAFTLATVFE